MKIGYTVEYPISSQTKVLSALTLARLAVQIDPVAAQEDPATALRKAARLWLHSVQFRDAMVDRISSDSPHDVWSLVLDFGPQLSEARKKKMIQEYFKENPALTLGTKADSEALNWWVKNAKAKKDRDMGFTALMAAIDNHLENAKAIKSQGFILIETLNELFELLRKSRTRGTYSSQNKSKKSY